MNRFYAICCFSYCFSVFFRSLKLSLITMGLEKSWWGLTRILQHPKYCTVLWYNWITVQMAHYYDWQHRLSFLDLMDATGPSLLSSGLSSGWIVACADRAGKSLGQTRRRGSCCLTVSPTSSILPIIVATDISHRRMLLRDASIDCPVVGVA